MILPRRVRWPLAILCRVLPQCDADALVGDLLEEYALRVQSSSRNAEQWCWRQILGSVAPLLWVRLKRGSWLITLGLALGLYLAASIVEFAGVTAVSKLLSTGPRGDAVSSLAVGLASMTLAGYFAAVLRSGAPAMLAAVSAIVIATLMATMSDSVPVWYQIAFLVLAPAAAMAGGALRHRLNVESVAGEVR